MLLNLFRSVAVFVALHMFTGICLAAPQAYSFSTGVTSGAFPGLGGLFGATATVSGTFSYDSAADYAITVPPFDVYGSYSPASALTPSFTSLSGSVDGHGFSDPQGVALVANDIVAGGVDEFSLNADPSLGSSSARNISGFTISGYTLWRVRLFWIEGYSTPDLIPDFVPGAGLLAAPPSFAGRLALDFIDASGADVGSIFYDGLTVAAIPEPETYAMLIAGLGLLGWRARRRRESKVA